MAFPAGSVPGLDVSHYNGVIDWASVVGAGEAFVYIKATEGLNTDDPYFIDNWRNSKKAGLLRGAYHFLHPNLDAQAQADHFLSRLTLANSGAKLNSGDLPAALDIEISGGVTPAALIASAKTWLNAVEAATGRVPMIYTSASFWKTNAQNVASFSRYPLWVANYKVAKPKLPTVWPNWTIWQFSEQGVPWLSANADLDAFQGDTAALKAFAGIKTQAPAKPARKPKPAAGKA
jgi:lysozyme